MNLKQMTIKPVAKSAAFFAASTLKLYASFCTLGDKVLVIKNAQRFCPDPLFLTHR
jgi:hypothetical protein